MAASGEDSGGSPGGVLRLGMRCEMAISGGCHWVLGYEGTNGSTSPLSHTGRKTVKRFFSRLAAHSRMSMMAR